MSAPARTWTCSYCGRTELQTGPRAIGIPPIPPKGWIRILVSRLVEIPAREGSKAREEHHTDEREACQPCATGIDIVVLLPVKVEGKPISQQIIEERR